MNLYLLKQNVNNGWDTYDSCVIRADNEEAAKAFHPSGDKYWNGSRWVWSMADSNSYYHNSTWVHPDDVTVTLIGKANNEESGVVIASFNAG